MGDLRKNKTWKKKKKKNYTAMFGMLRVAVYLQGSSFVFMIQQSSTVFVNENEIVLMRWKQIKVHIW